jgi:D-alanine--poly(phosphoribitol) ligase subunit 1
MYDYNLALRFQKIAAHNAERAAITFAPEDHVSYSELNKLANQMARLLIERGAEKGNVVCLSGEKKLLTFAAMIACLKLGCIYSILDPESPVERLRKIISTCSPTLLVLEAELASRLEHVTSNLSIGVVDQHSLRDEIAELDDTDLPETRDITGSDPAYIMFTSGSTGFPKGALMTHANVLNLIHWSRQTFSITVDDALTNVNALYFDNSVFDFYSSLFTGASLVPFSKSEVSDPGLLVQKIDRTGCTLWFSVPSLLMFLQTMKAVDGTRLKSIRRFIFGGEGYPKAKLKSLFDAYSPQSEFFNVYGPTECTCICSCYKISAADFDDLQGLPPLGRLIDNFELLIVDEDNLSVPVGEPGELCLLGPNVGKGYYNDPDRTAVAFVQNPRNKAFSEVMYKTGDLVKLNPLDGKLYICGRKDNQIKHMGYRIELEEIEAALHSLDHISEAAVLHANVNGLSRIVAIVSGKECDENQIRRDLKQIVPAYMVPSVFHREDRLPKTANGKVDRRSLAEKYLAGVATE